MACHQLYSHKKMVNGIFRSPATIKRTVFHICCKVLMERDEERHKKCENACDLHAFTSM